MLTLSDITKAYGERVLFAEATLQVNRAERIGLVGPNGAGKSTLLALVLGLEAPDRGQVLLERGVTVGHLPQEQVSVGEETVLEVATAISPELARLQRAIRLAETASPDSASLEAEAHARFSDLGGHTLRAKAKRMLAGLGFGERDYERPARELSGGWVMRAHLARLLVQEPDLLLLDEPTNHLDLETLLWFQGYLQNYPGAILLISHDRDFLNQLVGAIVEIRQGRLVRYRGNYDDFLAQRQAQIEHQWAAYKNQQREIDRLMLFVNRFRAKNTKASQAQSKLKQIERLEKIAPPESDPATVDFQFPQPPRSGLRVIRLRGVHYAYGDHVVYQGLDFEAQRGQRVVLVGPNGAGKSTLLKLLAGVLPVQSGARELGHHVRVGYYAQYRLEMLRPERTVLEEALATPQRVTEQFVRTLLGCFLFRGDDVFKPVRVLSGGEKSRLALVKLLLDPPNLLLMDEPTTHLDLESVEALIAALEPFEGTLIFISHDVYFIRQVANHVVHVRDGCLTHYPGGYDYFLDKTAGQAAGPRAWSEADQDASLAKTSGALLRKAQRRLEAEARNARSRERRALQATVQRLENEIHHLESRQAELIALLENPQTYADSRRTVEINLELGALVARLRDLTSQWESEASKLAAMEVCPASQ